MFTFDSGFQKKNYNLEKELGFALFGLVGFCLVGFVLALKLVQHSISLLPQSYISMFVELHREFFSAASYWLLTCFNISLMFFSFHVIKSSLFSGLCIAAFTKVAFSLTDADDARGLGALEVLL